MKYVAVLPYAYEPYFKEFMATCKLPKENMLIIDNTERNYGIMHSHNLGVEHMLENDVDFLIIISAAIRFGEKGGLDFIDQIEKHQDHHVIHAASMNVIPGMQKNPDGGGGHNEVFGWHLTAFHKSVFETIGKWDLNFSPYGFDDLDLSIRIRKGIPNVKWDTYPCDVHDTTMSHSINLAHVKSPSEPKIDYFYKKWGRYHGEWQKEAYDHPFNDETKGLDWFPLQGDAKANDEAWIFLATQGITK